MEDLLFTLKDTLVGERIEYLKNAYSELDEVQKRFSEDFGVSCIHSCGKCCQHYVPYLTETEALLSAYVIIMDGKEDEVMSRLNSGNPDSKVCPLYNSEGDFHCSLYNGRSMVCRLFGFSASQDKEGHVVWKACKWKGESGEKIDSSSLEKDRKSVPVMSEYGEKLEECGGTEGESIYDAIPKALWKVKMILRMTDSNPA